MVDMFDTTARLSPANWRATLVFTGQLAAEKRAELSTMSDEDWELYAPGIYLDKTTGEFLDKFGRTVDGWLVSQRAIVKTLNIGIKDPTTGNVLKVKPTETK
jgi:hypothetical protein